MNATNRYAPPPSAFKSATTHSAHCWRDGKDLVLLRDTPMPSRCVKCNEPAEPRKRALHLYWHHPAIYLLILVALLIYLIVALIVRKKASVYPAVCAVHRRQRAIAIAIGWIGTLGGFFTMVGTLSSDGPWSLLAFVAMIGSLIYGLAKGRIVVAKRIDDQYVRMRGCGGEFLDSLPNFS